jgi:hypothetical protein
LVAVVIALADDVVTGSQKGDGDLDGDATQKGLMWWVIVVPVVLFMSMTMVVSRRMGNDVLAGICGLPVLCAVLCAVLLVIADVFHLEPPLVLADEPTGNLDTASSDEVFALMRKMHAELRTSFLVVTHDPRLAARCDRVLELVDGRLVNDGAAPGPTR